MRPKDRTNFTIQLCSIILILVQNLPTSCHSLNKFSQPPNGTNVNVPSSTELDLKFEPEKSLEELYPTGKYLDPCKASKFHL